MFRPITPNHWETLGPLIDAVLDAAPDQRAALVSELSGGDEARRAELERLVAECERSDTLLDRPAAESFAALLDDEPLPVPETLGDRYRILRELGRGGMAVVYLARDLKHEREVAVKVVRPELAVALGRARFLREIEIAAQLRHPHIVPLFDSGEDDAFLYYVMPFEPGPSLRERLARGGPLPIDEAVRILRDVCGVLAHAHQHGIVHRDIKPENVLLSDRHAMVTDFGVAKAVTEAAGRGAVTTVGVALGTPAYMAPEQIMSDPHVDHRVDIYSLGVLAYELLTGRPPFEGETPQLVLSAHLTQAPEPITTHRPEVPPALAGLVMKCLEKRPADRWQRADELYDRLDSLSSPSGGIPSETVPRVRWKPKVVVAVGLVGVTALGVVTWQAAGGGARGEASRSAMTAARRAEPSIAVLPLANLSADPGDAALAVGITEELIATLARAGDVRVIASTSTSAFRDREVDVRRIADSLGVSNILEGSIQKIGSQLRVQVRLVAARDGSTRWSQVYDREFKDVFSVQDEIARAVAGELELRFDKDRQLRRHQTRSIAAYELYLRGSDPVLLRSESGVWKALDYFQQAIAADSTYAAAHAGLALVHVRRGRTASDPGMPLRELFALAENAARKAVALDDSLPEAHYVLGRVLEAMLEFPSAEAEIRRAIALDPTRSIYRRSLSYLHGWAGRPEEELAEARRALETDPLNPYAHAALAGALFGNRRFDEALAQFDRVATFQPPLQGVAFGVAQCYAKKQRWPEAIAALRPQAEAGDPLFRALLGHMLARAGQREEANRLLADLLARRERTGAGAFQVAVVYAGLGDLDQAFAWFDKSVDDRSIGSFIMGPTFEDLHGDPRFTRLRRRLGFQE